MRRRCFQLLISQNVLLQNSSRFQFAFKTLHISPGSVEIHLRCGGIFGDGIITNFPLTLTV